MEYNKERVESIILLLDDYRKDDPANINPQTFTQKILSKLPKEGEPYHDHDLMVTSKLTTDSSLLALADGRCIFTQVSGAISNKVLKMVLDEFKDLSRAERMKKVASDKEEFKKIKEEIGRKHKLC